MMEDNMNQDKSDSYLADHAAEDIQGKQIADLLNSHAKNLSLRTLKQLENGREQAVKAHIQQTGAINRDGTISGMVYWAEHHRIATTGMLLAAIVAGFVLTQAFSQNIEHGDAFLLGAELPPEAFVDTAFEPSLNTAHAKL
ncbi:MULTISPECIES: DUF3619 family protein [Methylotenera]|uniref:DUF3619 family protein n=1 Tax=Methylotenera TaxID=359407 RepID=UPI00037E0090|nr:MULTISPECIES: DUF3619 family protein [Methylotenera]